MRWINWKILNSLKGLALLLLLATASFPAASAAGKITDVRVWPQPENTRVIFDLSDKVKYKLFSLEDPHRIVIDVDGGLYQKPVPSSVLKNTKIRSIRHSRRPNGSLRIVLDLKEKGQVTHFLLDPNEQYGHRLVVDLAVKTRTLLQTQAPQKSKRSNKMMTKRQYIVAIDPGHGGEDSGAIGKNRHLKEKDVVLSVSKRLQTMINAQSGMRAFLVRTGDYYVGLRERMLIARKQGADLFISVHADSFKDTRASGASVFVLSEKGASNEAARWLAERENRSDLIGGVSLEDKGSLLASVLLDLSQTASQSASQELGNHLVSNLTKVTSMHHKTVQHAGFAVLKSPDIPSVLVELGFISNRRGEIRLSNDAHQEKLARALLHGVREYVAKRPAPIEPQPDFTLVEK